MNPVTLSKEEARNYLVAYQSLSDKRSLQSEEELLSYIRKVGCVQFDPVDVVGKNADLVLQSRFPKYKKEILPRLLYEERRLIDLWDKNMSICPVEDWPFFSRYRAHVKPQLAQYAKGVEAAALYLKNHEFCTAEELGLNEDGDSYFTKRTLGKAALEYMCYGGLAAVHHKSNTRRYYSLAERVVPPEILHAPDPNPSEEDFCAWLVLRRINSIGLLWNRGGDAWLGTVNFKSAHRNLGFQTLLARGAIAPLKIEGISHIFYIDVRNLPLLEESRGEDPGSSIRFIAPLDCILWDRQLISELFHFDYKWEVYTPAAKRKYGHYVLPLLRGSRFVGRIELAIQTMEERSALPAHRILSIRSIWWEDGVKETGALKVALRTRMRAFSKFSQCKTIDYNNYL